jgi:hypothetical protein
MASIQDATSALAGLPPDQRAVLQMVLGRGKSFDEIAQLLSIDRAAVRERALQALDALGPATRVPDGRRALITDYLLGQLPPRVSDEVRQSLANSASERAWARVVASELSPLSARPLPEIPVRVVEPEDERSRAAVPVPRRGDDGAVAPAAALEAEPAAEGSSLRSSRLGGALLLGAVGVAALVAILIFVVFSGGGGAHKVKHPSLGALTSTSASSLARPLHQINLSSPSGGKSPVGIAELLRAGSATEVVIVAQGLAANGKHDAYAVWLYNSSSDFRRLGYVQQPVTSSGKLETAGPLPSDASHFKQILVTLQTGPANKPGKIVLEGALAGA